MTKRYRSIGLTLIAFSTFFAGTLKLPGRRIILAVFGAHIATTALKTRDTI